MLCNFDLFMPDSFEEACKLKAEGAKPVAGGTDVYVNMHSGKEKCDKVLDLKNLEKLKGQIFTKGEGLDLGALTSHRRIEEWDIIKKYYYAMYQGCSQVGSVQIRYRGTLGGNIMNGAPSADSIGPMLVHDARAVVEGVNGEREIPLEQFYVGFKKFDCAEDELLTRIRIPEAPENSGSAYYKYMRRNAMDLALMGVSVYVEMDGNTAHNVRIALTTAASTPIRSHQAESILEGKDVTDELIVACAEAAENEGRPRSSWRSSAEFRKRLIHDITIQVVHEAVERARKPYAQKAEPIPARFYYGQIGIEPRKMED